MDEKRSKGSDPGHESRVREAFDAFASQHGARLDAEGRGLLDQLREAASRRDPDRVREHLAEAKQRHGWLYRELAEHPALATLLDELALWGF